MKKVYANLIGNWVCLNDDPDCVIGDEMLSPTMWYKESPKVYAPNNSEKIEPHSYYYLNYVNVHYKGIHYRINPIFIQIVTDEV